MNKITTQGIRKYGLTSLLLLLLSLSGKINAQETYTTLRKNVNPLAFNLNHELSNTQDSLLLDNKHLFKRVRFISDQAEKVFDFKPAVTSAKIPLDELPLGSYTVMFYQADKIIVFQIERLLPFNSFDSLESTVALNEAEIVSDDLESLDLNYDPTNDSLASNDNKSHSEFDNDTEYFVKPYNLSDLDREYVQTRAEYRRNNLRPNGKPFND